MLKMHRGARIPRLRLLLPFPLKNAPQRSETAITVARTDQLMFEPINLNYETGRGRFVDGSRCCADISLEIGPVRKQGSYRGM